MSASSSNVCNILDIPDEILVKIISHFSTRKRLPLANTCTRFNSLVFGDARLSRELDFSKNSRFTRTEDIQQYFKNEKTLEVVRIVNIENVNCIKPGKMLNNLIGKALHLVDVNVHGIKFLDVEQLGSFLEPLIHVKRLAVDWPESKNDVKMCRKFLHKPLSRLEYFSVKIHVHSVDFLPTVRLCQELEELRIVTNMSRQSLTRMSWDLEPDKLRKLKIVQVRGPQAMQMKKHLIHLLPDIQKWTDFQLTDISTELGFYLEKNVGVCEELRKTKLTKGIPYQRANPAYDIGWCLISEYLLQEVIEITHEDVPDTFCCLTPTLAPLEQDKEPCLLKIDEAKRLLRDPAGDHISFLYFKHRIESDCDAHLVASAFPNITELVLTEIIKNEDSVSTSIEKKHSKRRLRRRGSTLIRPEEQDDLTNLDSSFKILVDNTPNLEDLTIYSVNDSNVFERWDLAALCLIPRWENLRTLRLSFVPIRDAKFLVEIGKECRKLEIMFLNNLGVDETDYWGNDLSRMLNHCKNLREFSIHDHWIGNIPDLLTSLSGNLKLRIFGLISYNEEFKIDKTRKLTSSVEELIKKCKKLNTFVFIVRSLRRDDSVELTSALERIKGESNRPNFQFQTAADQFYEDGVKPCDRRTISEDALPSFFPRPLDGKMLTPF